MTRLTCAFGATWPCGPCRRCLQATEEACAQFARDVFFGRYDWDGYTPSERVHQTRAKVSA